MLCLRTVEGHLAKMFPRIEWPIKREVCIKIRNWNYTELKIRTPSISADPDQTLQNSVSYQVYTFVTCPKVFTHIINDKVSPLYTDIRYNDKFVIMIGDSNKYPDL